MEEAVNAVKDMKPPQYFLTEMLNKIVSHSLRRSDENREQASILIHAFCTEGLVTGENIMQVSIVRVSMQMVALFLVLFLNYILVFNSPF